MKRFLLLFGAWLSGIVAGAQNTFGIFVDSGTYAACTAELDAYRDCLRAEGLGAEILSGVWETPEQVRSAILRLAADRKHPLEGIVLVGEIPVVMVREAQWLTTAFKMNEQLFPIFESSVASDRYYDDFDLDFEFLQRDTTHAGVFYYRLTEKGAVTLRPDIYSARMKVPQVMLDAGGDAHAILRAYLRKVVAAHREENPLDRFTYFFGSGYNSEDMNLWRQRPVLYREYFPYAFGKASGNRFLNFHQEDVMKGNLFSELQREDVDVFQFSEHGAPDTQYISSTGTGRTLEENLYLLKSVTARQYLKWKGTKEDEGFQKAALDSVFHLPRSVVSDEALAYYRRVDSVARRRSNIYQDDLLAIRSNPRVVILNACYNGSFHNPDGYVAGVHVFGPGRCVVAQGNTVNVLQDKWEDKLLGYLSAGLRVGFWQREFSYLESHLVGDPTFRFTPHSKAEARQAARLERDLVRRPLDASLWRSRLRSDEALLRAAGILHLGYSGAADASDQALRLLREDSSWMVRMSALDVLQERSDGNADAAIVAAARDPFEQVVRHACRFAAARADAGRDSCVVRAMDTLLAEHPELARVQWDADDAATMIRGHEHLEKEMAKAADASLPGRQRIFAMRTFRNYRYLKAVPVLVDVALDTSLDPDVRQVALETLGWYDRTPVRGEIRAALGAVYLEDMPAILQSELLKTLKRLAR